MVLDLTRAQAERANEIHRDALVVDATTLWPASERRFLERMKNVGGVDCCFMTVQTNTFESTARQLATVLKNLDQSADIAVQATSVAEIRQAKQDGKLAVVLMTQNAAMVGEDLSLLRTMHRWGYRSIGISYSGGNLLGDGCGEKRDGGLTYLGEESVAELNRLHILVDCAHVGDASTRDCLRLSSQPVVFTHSNVRALSNTTRNKPDDIIKLMAEKGGVQGLTSLPKMVREDLRNATLDDLLNHVDYLKRLVGVDHIGIGTDFTDAVDRGIKMSEGDAKVWRTRRPEMLGTVDEWELPYARGLRHSGELPNVTAGLVTRGYTDDEIRKILGENWLRVLAQVAG
ncbi:MAG: membrane dipeptidase [Chloroflexi bacterium]|nr:membrane dipeptidase [Chloroflexota bacterium]